MSGRASESNRQRWLVPVLVLVLSLTVGGGLLIREWYRQPDDADAATVAEPSRQSLAPHEQPGPQAVELTPDASAHPEEKAVRRLLQTYFDAINGGNYERWKTTVSRERVRLMPEAKWVRDYKTTKDGNVLVYRIEEQPDDRLHVLVGFTSTQDPTDAPPDLPEPCIRWYMTWPVVQERGTWKLDTVPAGTTPEHRRCSAAASRFRGSG